MITNICFDEFTPGILRRILFINKIASCKKVSKIYFESNRFHYPIYNINIWNFSKNKRPWLFLNERGNGKNGAFYRIITGGLRNEKNI